VPHFARPIPSVRLSIRLSVTSRSTVITVRDRPMVTMGSLQECYYPAYSEDPSPTPYDHPFPQNEGSQPPVKTCIANCGETVPETTVVCTDSLWEHIAALPKSTITDPLWAPLPPNGVVMPSIGCVVEFPCLLVYIVIYRQPSFHPFLKDF